MRAFKSLLILSFLAAAGLSGNAAAQSATRTDDFEVRITIQGTCTVLTASDIDFGTTTPIAGTRNQTGAINVQCTNGTPYSLGLDGGNADDVANRRMSNGPVEIPYTLSSVSAGGSVWGNDASNWVSGNGAGVGAAYEIEHEVYAQATLTGNEPAGTYTDTVTATLTY